MIRSLIVILLVGICLPLALKNPHAGLLLWEWITLMNAHKIIFGFGADLRFNLVIAVVTLGAWLFSKEKKAPPMGAASTFFVMFVLWMCVVQAGSLKPDYSLPLFDRFIRIMVFVWLALCMSNTRWRLHAVVWVYVISIAYYGIRGGGFTLISGGGYLVFGPAQTVLGDNNHLALAMTMILPMLNYLRLQSEIHWLRLGLLAAMGLTVVAVLGTHSRGGFIALAVMGLFFWWYSAAKVRLTLLGLAVLIPALIFMPTEWYDRIATIGEASEDASFQGRVDAWVIAFETAVHNPLTGGGFRVPYLQEVADLYLDEFRKARAAHSIYFEILGSMGFVGLFFYLGIAGFTLLSTMRINRRCKKLEGMQWADDLAKMCRASLLAYWVAGASMSMEFYDGYWLMVAVVANLNVIVDQAYKKVRKTERTSKRRGRSRNGEEEAGLDEEETATDTGEGIPEEPAADPRKRGRRRPVSGTASRRKLKGSREHG